MVLTYNESKEEEEEEEEEATRDKREAWVLGNTVALYI
jgi:hypothetical protein